MGVIQSADREDEKGPACPFMFISTFEKYRALKFVQRETDDRITIYPRNLLSWQDLAAFRDVTGQAISALESELIMGIDAIFEGRDDG